MAHTDNLAVRVAIVRVEKSPLGVTNGDTPLTRHLTTPALIDVRTGELTAVAEPPWYVATLGLSQPLHFGDYGGLGLQIVWAILDPAAIVILGSGLWLWVERRRRPK